MRWVIFGNRRPLAAQVEALGMGAPAFVFSTTHTDDYLADIVSLISPQGRIALIDDPKSLDIALLKRKSLSLHWEFMFTRPLMGTADLQCQQDILRNVAALADAGKLATTRTRSFGLINAANLRQAHALIESGQSIGKLTLSGFAS